MKNLRNVLCYSILLAFAACSQKSNIREHQIEFKNVTGSFVELDGEEVLKVERDLNALPFDNNRLVATVNEPTYAKLTDVDFENGVIEVKVLSRIQKNTPYPGSWGFIGLAYRIAANDTAFESFYVRPKVGRSSNPGARNQTVQYFAYPHYKFDRLMREASGQYETSADIGLNEWITLRVEVEGQKATLYINDKKEPTMVVDQMKGNLKGGAIGLFVDIGTEGYFKDLKITKK
jgi:hypothetical protein